MQARIDCRLVEMIFEPVSWRDLRVWSVTDYLMVYDVTLLDSSTYTYTL